MTADVIAGAILDVNGGTNFRSEAIAEAGGGKRVVRCGAGLAPPNERLKMFIFSRDCRPSARVSTIDRTEPKRP